MHTSSSNIVAPLNWDDIADKYHELLEQFKDMPTDFVCAQNVYDRLLQEVEHVKPNPKDNWTIFGINIEIDEDMKPGQWKFKYNRKSP